MRYHLVILPYRVFKPLRMSFFVWIKLKKEFSNVQYLESTSNLGFTGGNNLGINAALKSKFDLILLLNNDTEVEPDFLSNLIHFQQANPEYGIVQPLILFNQESLNVDLVDEMYFWLPNSDEYYKIIRENIVKNKSKKLLRALSSFKNKNDIDLIKSFGKDSFIGIANFKDDAFLEMFEKYISLNDNWEYKFALNQYPKSKTRMIYLKIENYNTVKK